MSRYNYIDILRNIDENRILLEVPIKVRFLYLGGFNTWMFYVPINYVECLTGKQMKSLWRFWTRTYVSALNNGNITYKECDELIADKLGLGGGKNVQPSEISLIVENVRAKVVDLFSKDSEGIKVYFKSGKVRSSTKTRWAIRLQGIRKDQWKHYKSNGFGKLYEEAHYKVYLIYNANNAIPERNNFLVISFLTSLFLDGVGWAKNRGFGSITPLPKIHLHESLNIDIEKIYNEILGNLKRGYHNKAREYLFGLFEMGMNYLKKILKESRLSNQPWPKIPTISSKYNSKYFKLDIIPKENISYFKLLECIGRSTLKNTWKSDIYNRNIRSQGRDLHTWVLGLPRRFKNRGYQDDISRFPSSIRMKILDFGSKKYILIYGFLTEDLKILHQKLKHCNNNGCKPVLGISNSDPYTAFTTAWNNIMGILERC